MLLQYLGQNLTYSDFNQNFADLTMTYTEADIPLRAPRLLQLSANVVAAHSSTLLAHPKSTTTNERSDQNHAQQQHQQEQQNVSNDTAAVFQLPLPASTAVFGSLREQWIKTVCNFCHVILPKRFNLSFHTQVFNSMNLRSKLNFKFSLTPY